MEKAAREDKLVLLDFTGSDWCGWCQALVADTFSKREFMDYARKNLVLVEVDFPMHKEQPAALKKANKALKKKYGVEGYPTVVIMKADGTVLWKQPGYQPGGANAMIAILNRINPNARPVTPIAPAAAAAPPVAAQKPAPPAPKPPELPTVQAILFSSSHPSVVLNGIPYQEGESVKGMKILKIARNKVIVEWNGETMELH